MHDFGYGKGYRYAHSEPEHFARGAGYLPEELGRPEYFQPGPGPFETAAYERLRRFREGPAADEGKADVDQD
jgi:putative ATPase